ncbi:hypothetical protein [Xanthocytophaga agilis]|uniref:Uncharacterized protein n=1 Tax=Xanthocytophaga agilis TaxID=3048010 RepID=A0AAE3R7R1_9BACT|nr:hypothetical protein [Xanthocytophaga agilis]MDJ1505221.1 hypothetical protein [Xanthocytophaga agilis]
MKSKKNPSTHFNLKKKTLSSLTPLTELETKQINGGSGGRNCGTTITACTTGISI